MTTPPITSLQLPPGETRMQYEKYATLQSLPPSVSGQHDAQWSDDLRSHVTSDHQPACPLCDAAMEYCTVTETVRSTTATVTDGKLTTYERHVKTYDGEATDAPAYLSCRGCNRTFEVSGGADLERY